MDSLKFEIEIFQPDDSSQFNSERFSEDFLSLNGLVRHHDIEDKSFLINLHRVIILVLFNGLLGLLVTHCLLLDLASDVLNLALVLLLEVADGCVVKLELDLTV